MNPLEKPPASGEPKAGRQGPEPDEPFEGPQGPKPPVFNRWSGWYWLVFLVMAAQVLLYLYITKSFS